MPAKPTAKKSVEPLNLASLPGARSFDTSNNLQVAFPVGGMGAGCVCFNGYGGFQDYSIRNKPALSALPDGHDATQDMAFAVLRVAGKKPVCKLVEGPVPVEKIYSLGLQGQGYRKGGNTGLPRFAECAFTGAFPFATVELKDPDVPVGVSVTAWNPFIPLDADASGLPLAVVEYTLTNRTRKPVTCELSFHLSHFSHRTQWNKPETSRNSVIPRAGVSMTNLEPGTSEDFGSAALMALLHKPKIKAMWFRGGWFDSISVLWRELSEGTFTTNDGSLAEKCTGANGGSVLVPVELAPGESVCVPFAFAWHFPNCHYITGPGKPNRENACCAGSSGGCCDPKPDWQPWYATRYTDAQDVLLYLRKNYHSLRERTVAFHQALFSSTLPPAVLDAISANLAILKSPTVLRQANGSLWGWEGCFATAGCCNGTCTHVWNYAQTLPHLFPALERGLREQELRWSMDDKGHVNFRAALPERETDHGWHAASDGQLGGMMKLWRDWQHSGDDAWMLKLLPLAKRSMEYCIRSWDPEETGALVEPHHNTYDIEFWGPDGMCSTIYLGALTAMASLCSHAGWQADAERYRNLAAKSATAIDGTLFNGEYYYQKVRWLDLADQSLKQKIETGAVTNPEELALLQREGPKYQYGTGCLSDGVIGAWMAKLYGMETALDSTRVCAHLKSVYKYNFRKDLWTHANTQRPGYAMGHEGGLLVCSWPKGGKPLLPFPYSDEVFTGIEYQVASHLILMGLVGEGTTIVETLRMRFDGRTRNPWNEYECGNYYARAMASYSLLASFGGMRYSAIEKTLWLDPKIDAETIRLFFATNTGWGQLVLTGNQLEVVPCEGKLELKRVVIRGVEYKVVGTKVQSTKGTKFRHPGVRTQATGFPANPGK
ncbi:MAG: GH116 family glycosyl hydrolase [Verrucomicrobiota bacterium]|nr:GH116 family glycosyl hydrolase [Verrucomicrobiota bacterium]